MVCRTANAANAETRIHLAKGVVLARELRSTSLFIGRSCGEDLKIRCSAEYTQRKITFIGAMAPRRRLSKAERGTDMME
jgi:hypothetical protein